MLIVCTYIAKLWLWKATWKRNQNIAEKIDVCSALRDTQERKLWTTSQAVVDDCEYHSDVRTLENLARKASFLLGFLWCTPVRCLTSHGVVWGRGLSVTLEHV